MSYLDLIKQFWIKDELMSFNGNETRLYFFLLNLFNRAYWPEWVEYGDKRMSANIGLSINAMKSARTKLKDASLINFIVGGQGHRVKTRYHLLMPCPTPNLIPKSESYNKTNAKDFNKQIYNGKRKGFVHNGSDFDE